MGNGVDFSPLGGGLNIADLAKETEELLFWMASYGKQEHGGVTRLLYSEDWLRAQRALALKMEQWGMSASFDQVGNLFGRLEGSDRGKKAVLTGSHIDTVKNGGLYDGAFGIAAGMVALKYLKRHFGTPKRSLEAISLCEEEGDRFPMTYWGSGSITGSRGFEQIAEMTDGDGVPFEEAMKKCGFGKGTYRDSRRDDIAAFIELHVEQGIVLERKNKPIGIVDAIVGQRRYTFQVTGEANHAGTTPMIWRKDAVGGASEMIRRLLNAAQDEGEPMVATVGRIEVEPNVANVIPGKVTFTADIRHPERGGAEVLLRTVLSRIHGDCRAAGPCAASRAVDGCVSGSDG
ncbi:hydantoinase/carbamoylase family amidase [Paenibacillus sp. P26]|nr:hydantoinase/carbamoylase family amidase [Paenibacillus sp. P26]